MIVNVFFNHFRLIWAIYFVVTALHLFANYKAVKSLNINVFNSARFDLTLKHYLSNDTQNHDVQKPDYINKREACFLEGKFLDNIIIIYYFILLILIMYMFIINI